MRSVLVLAGSALMLSGCLTQGLARMNVPASSQGQGVTANLISVKGAVLTISGQPGVECEYIVGSTRFWRTIVAPSCPYTIQVQ